MLLQNELDSLFPIGCMVTNTTGKNPSEYLGGTWTNSFRSVIDTGWLDLENKNSTYMDTTQSSYTLNKWRVRDNILYVAVGAGATSNINIASEDQIATIPIASGFPSGTANRIWTGAVGGSGAQAGFYLKQNSSNISVHIKPHTSSNDFVAPWYSTFFVVPLYGDCVVSNYLKEYGWRRTA